jgi:hypothetical protein
LFIYNNFNIPPPGQAPQKKIQNCYFIKYIYIYVIKRWCLKVRLRTVSVDNGK